MAERNVGRSWTEEEDKLLTDAVRRYGEQDNWKTIAVSVPGRTNKACRKRWLHSLSPNVKKTAWTADEDKLLIDLHSIHGPKWSAIARQIPGRTDDACSKRYREALDPSLRKDEWTAEEDQKLLEVYARLGGKWGQVGQEFGRSGLGCRNRWRLLERKKKAGEAQMQKSRQIYSLTDISESSAHTPYTPHQVLQLDPILEDAGSLGYCPSEVYAAIDPAFRNETLHCLPTPDDIRPLHAQVAPFQVSSTSSLSKALSDPPQIHRPLPPVTPAQPPEPQLNSGNLSSSSLASSPLYPPSNDMSQDTIMVFDGLDDSNLEDLFSSVDYASQTLYSSGCLPSHQDSGLFNSVSPLTFPSEMPPSDPSNVLHVGFLKSPNPLASIDMSVFEQSSATTTPFHIPSPISSSSSPHISLSQELPSYEQQPTAGSLLFSGHPGPNSRPSPIFSHNTGYSQSSSRFQTPAISCTSTPSTQHIPYQQLMQAASEPYVPVSQHTSPVQQTTAPLPSSTTKFYPAKRLKKTASKKPPKPPQMKHSSRLSSALALCDPNLRPYACGRESCWPNDATIGIACYATSKELLDHTKDEHADDLPGDRPFRCALAGCGKSWKSVNGLQYHLQVSTAHFRYALSSATRSTPFDDPIQTGSGTETEAEDPLRAFYCHHAHCPKAYRQPSGLRYHLKHGHPEEMPAQLPTVPPALARHISSKARKRRKPTSEAEE